MDASPEKKVSGRYLAVLSLSALGVVYGDIGTSPLYALRECFHLKHGVTATPENIIGILSLICWSLIIVISLKYLVFVMRADNRGEGGILALMSLAPMKSTQFDQLDKLPPRPPEARPYSDENWFVITWTSAKDSREGENRLPAERSSLLSKPSIVTLFE